jgi:hypothetical protein
MQTRFKQDGPPWHECSCGCRWTFGDREIAEQHNDRCLGQLSTVMAGEWVRA